MYDFDGLMYDSDRMMYDSGGTDVPRILSCRMHDSLSVKQKPIPDSLRLQEL